MNKHAAGALRLGRKHREALQWKWQKAEWRRQDREKLQAATIRPDLLLVPADLEREGHVTWGFLK